MEDIMKKNTTGGDKDIVFSKAIKAGKRIYYLDGKVKAEVFNQKKAEKDKQVCSKGTNNLDRNSDF